MTDVRASELTHHRARTRAASQAGSCRLHSSGFSKFYAHRGACDYPGRDATADGQWNHYKGRTATSLDRLARSAEEFGSHAPAAAETQHGQGAAC